MPMTVQRVLVRLEGVKAPDHLRSWLRANLEDIQVNALSAWPLRVRPGDELGGIVVDCFAESEAAAEEAVRRAMQGCPLEMRAETMTTRGA